MGADWINIFLDYVCPSLGCIMSNLMFAAPVHDLRQALQKGRLGELNPVPWAVMTGNCLGWIAYAYYTKDPFVLASNVPGFVLSFWLNSGASKLQYYELWNELKESGGTGIGNEAIVAVLQEKMLLCMLTAWSIVLILVGWVPHAYSSATIVGLVVNVNLVFFYGAPLEAIKRVIRSQSSDAIHSPTMFLNWVNTSFWMAYGVARHDPVIYVPNGIGLLLGIAQGILVCIYPKQSGNSSAESQSQVGLLNELLLENTPEAETLMQ